MRQNRHNRTATEARHASPLIANSRTKPACLASPAPPKKPLHRAEPAPKPAATLTAKPRGVSWWASVCGPDQREEFIAAARARDIEGQSEAVWQRPDNFAQLGPRSA